MNNTPKPPKKSIFEHFYYKVQLWLFVVFKILESSLNQVIINPYAKKCLKIDFLGDFGVFLTKNTPKTQKKPFSEINISPSFIFYHLGLFLRPLGPQKTLYMSSLVFVVAWPDEVP